MKPRHLLHLLVFAMPVFTLIFLITAPHSFGVALGCSGMLIAAVLFDMYAGPERTQPDDDLPAWPFDAALYALFALQMTNMVLIWRVPMVSGFFSADTAAAIWLGGASSGYSAIVVAHELIHRPKKHQQLMARILMGSVLYEHFCTEHIRGHHRRVATEDDPATARFDETFFAFFARTVPGQLQSAMALNPRWVKQGLAVEWSVAGALLLVAPPAFGAHVLQSLWAIILLEAVNYVEHWGLSRQAKRVGVLDSWDSESWFTYYTLVGLSRHADHHAYASRPYQSLRHFDESLKMPFGYWGTVISALFHNSWLRQVLTDELQRRKLGPFQEEQTALS